MRFHAFTIAATLACIVAFDLPAKAGSILDPAGVTTNMGSLGSGTTFNVNNLIDQSGLSSTYTSGVTDFTAYTASATHNSSSATNTWESARAKTTGNVDFNLGGSFSIDAIAIWNFQASNSADLRNFTLLAGGDPSFTSATSLGSFTSTAPGSLSTSIPAEVFTFTPTMASYIRMEITGNFGNNKVTGFGEAAFDVTAPDVVPEPSSLLMIGTGAVCLAVAHRRRKRGSSRAG